MIQSFSKILVRLFRTSINALMIAALLAGLILSPLIGIGQRLPHGGTESLAEALPENFLGAAIASAAPIQKPFEGAAVAPVMQAITISTDKTFYQPGEDIVVTFTGAPGNANDGIGIYYASGSLGSFQTLGGATDGSITFSGITFPYGEYTADMYLDGVAGFQARSNFTIAPPPGTAEGLVFHDDNIYDSVRDGAEQGRLANVLVTAIDEAGAVYTTTTAVDGSYTLAGITGDQLRMEFTLPTDGSLDDYTPTLAGQSTVQFFSNIQSAGAAAEVGYYQPYPAA